MRFLLFFFITAFLTLTAKPPQLSPRDTRTKIDEILKAHACYQKLTPELTKRALINFLEELDPGKIYFIESEIIQWIDPSESLITQTLGGYTTEDFTTFETIHEKMLYAIQRRNDFEENINQLQLPQNVQASEFKDLKWAKTEDELKERLLRIKAIQFETAEKIDPEHHDQFAQRLNKRRLSKEQELLGSSLPERKQLILSYVLKATSSALDSQTLYFTPTEANQFMMQVQQRLFGIGALMRDNLNGFTVIRLVEGSPAIQPNKLKIGDRIVAVNHEPVVGLDIIETVEKIRGPQGSAVTLTIFREKKDDSQNTMEEEKLEIEIIRDEIALKESRLETTYEPYGDGVIGIFHLFSFYQDNHTSSAKDLAEAINKLKKEHNLTGVILDLRNNGGGLLPQAVAVTGLFISKGVVVSVKDNTGAIQHLRNMEGRALWDGPLLVLTNRASASAAEIVAQTLQEYGRTLVIGDRETYGKGTFQTFTLETSNFGKVNPKGEYKVTRGRYYTVSGKTPQLVGVKADIVVPGLFAEMELGEKYGKFPIESDQIAPHFEDDLSDIPPFHRKKFISLYQQEHQQILTTYLPYVENLKKNSELRLKLNQNYQNFLKEIEKKEDSGISSEFFGQSDLQLVETLNIFKDFLLLSKGQAQSPAA